MIGLLDGSLEGRTEGKAVGFLDGSVLGMSLGKLEIILGNKDGIKLGVSEGFELDIERPSTSNVGETLGWQSKEIGSQGISKL